MKQTPILTGREATTLSLLASARTSVSHKKKILSTLTGHAFKIGKVLIGDGKGASRQVKKAAEGFKIWAGYYDRAYQNKSG